MELEEAVTRAYCNERPETYEKPEPVLAPTVPYPFILEAVNANIYDLRTQILRLTADLRMEHRRRAIIESELNRQNKDLISYYRMFDSFNPPDGPGPHPIRELGFQIQQVMQRASIAETALEACEIVAKEFLGDSYDPEKSLALQVKEFVDVCCVSEEYRNRNKTKVEFEEDPAINRALPSGLCAPEMDTIKPAGGWVSATGGII